MVKVIFGQIEHRLFSHITTNWRGRPLTSHEVVLNTIAATTTRTGLRVEAVLDHGTYPTGVAVSRDQIQALSITPHAEHGPWNYSIAPTGASTAPPRADQRAKARTETLQLLADPRLTGMSTAELDTLQARLAPTQAARSEQHRYVLRGGRRVATTGRSRSLLRDAVEVLLTVLYLRQVFPQKVLCDLLGINPVTISQAIKATRQLIDEQKISITPTVMRYFTHAEDLHAWNTNAGPATHPPTLPARYPMTDPRLTGMTRAALHALLEELIVSYAAAIEHAATLGIDAEVVPRNTETRGFHVVKRRWVVERSLGWLMLHRRLTRDYETRPDSSEAVIHIAMLDNVSRRITDESTPTWRGPY